MVYQCFIRAVDRRARAVRSKKRGVVRPRRDMKQGRKCDGSLSFGPEGDEADTGSNQTGNASLQHRRLILVYPFYFKSNF